MSGDAQMKKRAKKRACDDPRYRERARIQTLAWAEGRP